ncbi:Tol biopolymer transporter periplasmic protein [Pantanalinema rosaneae CENA516]|uniref:TolB family protein n=1 Tax=Pantanalinema rosaneae TaxID=1620701 RepID=UPI003D6DFD48
MRLRTILGLVLAGCLGGCGGSRLITFPYDPSGRSLNSPFGEVTPRIAGRYIVFSSDRRGSQDIYLYDMVDQTLVELPGLNAIDTLESNPAVSENGRFIVFAGNRQGQSGIYLYDRNTRQLRNLTENLRAAVRNPVISADGNVIAFEASVNGQWDILLYNRMGQPINGVNPSR